MVSYLIDDHWNKFIPEGIRKEIQTCEDVDTAMEVFLKEDDAKPELIKKHQHLYNHIKNTKKFYLENLDEKFFITSSELMDEFKKMKIPEATGMSQPMKETFMKEKKTHEVEVISDIIAMLSKARGKDHFIVDVGDGKGYLSSRLSLEFKLKVLGIDGNQKNSFEAEKRNKKLSKKWNAFEKKLIEPISDVEFQPTNDYYKTASKMVFANTDLKALAIEKFPDENIDNICLVGLHTCGNLAPNSLKQFANNDDVKIVCSVGCCYHLLHEEFEKDFFNGEQRQMEELDEPGFPLSNYLREKQCKIGRNARMLAAQAYERVKVEQNMPDDSLFYRALFDKLLRDLWLPNEPRKVHRLGKIRSKTFEEYLQKGCKKFNIDMKLSSEEIEQLYKDHEFERRVINLSYFLRLLNAKIIETLILLDRYLFLLEGDNIAFLVQMFDPVISPRNYALIAIKK